MNLLNKIGKFFRKESPIKSDVPTEEKQERMPTGESNGSLSVHERNEKNRLQNKQKRRKKANKIARASRKYNYQKAA